MNLGPLHDDKKRPYLDADILGDLRTKQQLITAACQCLEDHGAYIFFDGLASLAKMEPDTREQFLNRFENSGTYRADELAALRRLVMSGGASAFKEFIDHIREIKIEQEIQEMAS